MKNLYFIRHGLSEMNKQGVWSGTSETPLSAEGRKQAKQAGKQAKNLHIDYIVCSPLSRALDTAKIIAQEIGYPEDNIHINDLFIERHWGELEGQAWNPDLDLDGFSDVETRDSIVERARLAIEFLKTLDAHNILVVSHGSFGRAMRHHLINHPYTNRRGPNEPIIPNAEIVKWL
jgi:broad specificity phosphatase PhoE